MRVASIQIVTNGDMSTSEIDSTGINLDQVINGSVQAIWTGSPVGTIELQVSNDAVQVALGANPAANVVNWSLYSGTDQSLNGAGSFFWNLSDIGYRWIRLVYLKGSGTGSLNATATIKGA